jgi:hypothetical protein
MGYASRAEFMTMNNPDLTTQDAMVAIKSNLALEAAYTSKIRPAVLPLAQGEKKEPVAPAQSAEIDADSLLQQLSLTMQRLKPVGEAKNTAEETRILKATAAKLLTLIKGLDT